MKKNQNISTSGEVETVKFEVPTIEVVELVCQNTPDWTHGTQSMV